MPSPQPDRAPFVTFYSYKGGVGRSMAVLNVAALLAARGFRVLIIDFDLEAPGLTHLFGREEKKAKTSMNAPAGVVELLADAKANGETAELFAKGFAAIASDFTFACQIPSELKPNKDGRLHIMPAGRTDASYAARFDDLDLADLYQQGVGRGLMLHLKKEVAECGLYDYVIVDSRTGHSDEAGICTRDLADHLMIVSGFNRQNIAGTASFLVNLRTSLGAEYEKLRSPDIILSPVPIGEEDLLAGQEKTARTEFQAAWGKKLPLNLSIPYHPRLALTEDAYVTTRTTSYLKTAYSDIEDRLLDSLGHRSTHLFQNAAEAIKVGDGPTALAAIRRALKLQRASSRCLPRSSWDIHWHYHLNFVENKELLDQLLKLPEAGEIIKELSTAAGSLNGLIQLGQQLHQKGVGEAKIADEAILSSSYIDADLVGNYAVFLHREMVKLRKERYRNRAEDFYKIALKADPKNYKNLGNYAVFLHYLTDKPHSAEPFYKRSNDINPSDPYYVSNYASFLGNICEDRDGAKAIYERAIEAEPKNATNFGNYAKFLSDFLEEHDKAEELFERAIVADPKHENSLRIYANFLRFVRNDLFSAESHFKRAIKLAPESAHHLGDYGQLLIGTSRLEDGLEMLRQAWQNREATGRGNCAELAYSLWLGSCLANSEERKWERIFKAYIEADFERHRWNFDAMLAQAKLAMSPPSFKYARALAAAFLDQGKVAALEGFARWKKLKPLDPDLMTRGVPIQDV